MKYLFPLIFITVFVVVLLMCAVFKFITSVILP